MPEQTPTLATATTAAVRDALVEHAPPQRFVAQRGLFTGPSPLVSDDLYVQVTHGRGHRRRAELRLEPYSRATSNTYFGRLPGQLLPAVDHRHRGQLRWPSTLGAGAVVRRRLRRERRRPHGRRHGGGRPGTAVLTARLNEFVDGGALWMECTAVGGPLTITDLEWTAPRRRTIRPAAIAICTFNRADDCAATVRAIAGDKGLLAGIDAVYVVDQGTDAVETRPLFNDVAAQLGDKLVYLRQPNLGGAGGFTRGLYRGVEHRRPRERDPDGRRHPAASRKRYCGSTPSRT